MTDDESKKIKIELDHEQKVIRLGCCFYDLKGVLIAEATEEDKKKYDCGKYMTYPIVDDDWEVREDECLKEGIKWLTIGKKGDTIPLVWLRSALNLNAEEHYCDYSNILTEVESHGITISNRVTDNPQEELPDEIILKIDKNSKANEYVIFSDWKGYFIPDRTCHVGNDGKLYQGKDVKEKEGGQYQTIVYQIAEDVSGLCWFFNNHNLKVRCVNFASTDDKIPDDWHHSFKTLEDDINCEIKRMEEESDYNYYPRKLPII